VLRLKLARLDGWNDLRAGHAGVYNRAFRESGIVTPWQAPDACHVYHQYVIQVDGRDDVQRALAGRGVETGVHYPVPCHLQEACAGLGYRIGSLPQTERCVERILSLPVYPEMTEEQRAHVIESVLTATAGEAMEEAA
jgi:dTDP-4-amino-4,6-dideoxygalactose transaminase